MHLRDIPASIVLLGTAALALAGDGSVKVQDKSKPVRAELEQEYARLEAAMERNDTEAVLAFYLPEFRGDDCRGDTYPPAVLWSRTRANAAPKHPIEVALTLGTIDLNGEDEAVVTVHRMISRTEPMHDGKLHKVETVQTHDDTWVRTPEGWRLRSLTNVREFDWYVDGKRIGKSMPWEPDAPAYVPPQEEENPYHRR